MEKKLFLAFIITHSKYLSEPKYQKDVLEILKNIETSNTMGRLFLDFFKQEFEPFIDALTGVNPDEKMTALLDFSKKGLVYKVFSDTVSTLNSREIQSFVKNIYTTFSPGSSIVIIRTPRELPVTSRKNIRQHYKNDGVIFETQVELIGGMLVYKNGSIIDQSFSSYLSRIYSLNS